mmetsp:Transcript_37420/g.90830  ORF Transcript_37420/g.90830 Transcript_37420/m.90830 type:complete len:401 (+) Transcript_37420:128-1330(+)|eukprot:CAMPEP_0113628656 /NCGR_PEP_ID=MMETSP0017_2-20120614/14851_1 /TAXON_ID=2856 /ORGANISM="Cylindrotheca closterium" /LENGTH=400 /DNA_ID=CAMNT_0000538975 /DNA_START=94 /DNA_END=1296 /DNA_ORIENTATION=+ /assembly_acc=CAM_ASM_000147
MKRTPYILALLTLLVISEPAQAQDETDEIVQNSNAAPDCDNSESGLAVYGAKRTCIESTEFEGKRCFFTYIPDCAGEDSPLVFDLHGWGSCPLFSAFYTGWRQLAQQNCFVLIWPLGTTDPTVADLTCWGNRGGLLNQDGSKFSGPCCCSKGAIPVFTDPGAFLRQAAAVAVRDIPKETSNSTTIDSKRIYMAGHSNGCMTSISMAATHSDMVAAVGCHSGRATTLFPEDYSATPMAFIHGTSDRIVAYEGAAFQFGAQEYLSIVSQTNGCTASTETRTEAYAGTSNIVTEYRSSSCNNNADVVLYSVDNVGHQPYYISSQVLKNTEFGTVPVEFDTTKLMWDFVKEHSLDVEPELEVKPVTMAPSLQPSMMPTISASMRVQVGLTLTGAIVAAALLTAV